MDNYLQSFNMIVEQAHLCFKEKTTAVNLGTASSFFIAARKLGSNFQQSGGNVGHKYGFTIAGKKNFDSTKVLSSKSQPRLEVQLESYDLIGFSAKQCSYGESFLSFFSWLQVKNFMMPVFLIQVSNGFQRFSPVRSDVR